MKVIRSLLALATVVVPVSSQNDPCYICGIDQQVKSLDAEIVIPGQGSNPCTSMETLGLGGGLTAEQCTEISPFAQDQCGCGVFQCNVCGDGMVVGDTTGSLALPNDGGFVTCAAIFETAQSGGVNQTECLAIQNLTQVPCACEAGSTPTISSPSSPVTFPTPSPVAAPDSSGSFLGIAFSMAMLLATALNI